MTNANESQFRYEDGYSHADFNLLSFVPTFFVEANATLRAEAASVCNDNAQCMFDYVATGNLLLAQETTAAEQQGLQSQEDSSM